MNERINEREEKRGNKVRAVWSDSALLLTGSRRLSQNEAETRCNFVCLLLLLFVLVLHPKPRISPSSSFPDVLWLRRRLGCCSNLNLNCSSLHNFLNQLPVQSHLLIVRHYLFYYTQPQPHTAPYWLIKMNFVALLFCCSFSCWCTLTRSLSGF